MMEEQKDKLAKQLIQNIENGTICKKVDSFSTDYYDKYVEELCLYRYKRYIGSLRCMLDTQAMRQDIDKPLVKRLVK